MAKTKTIANNKTVATTASVAEFIAAIKDDTKRNDCFALNTLFKKQSKFPAKLWGPSIVGYGSYHYVYESGREGDAPLLAFAPRANTIVLYLSCRNNQQQALMKHLGKYKMSGGCMHIKTLADIKTEVLIKMIDNHLAEMRKLYPAKK